MDNIEAVAAFLLRHQLATADTSASSQPGASLAVIRGLRRVLLSVCQATGFDPSTIETVGEAIPLDDLTDAQRGRSQ